MGRYSTKKQVIEEANKSLEERYISEQSITSDPLFSFISEPSKFKNDPTFMSRFRSFLGSDDTDDTETKSEPTKVKDEPKKVIDDPKKADLVDANLNNFYSTLEAASKKGGLNQEPKGNTTYQKDVEAMQIGLILLGYQLPKHGVDGKFGSETASAVKKFIDDNLGSTVKLEGYLSKLNYINGIILNIDRILGESMGINDVDEAMVELEDAVPSYPNLTLSNKNKIGKDVIPQQLLSDVQTAAERSNVRLTINYAKSNHKKNTKSGRVSRHSKSQALDLSSINGGSFTSKSGTEAGNRFTAEMEKLGYARNVERGNPKSVLWQMAGHYDHIHVSYTLDGASEEERSKYDVDKSTGTDSKTTTDSKTNTKGGLISATSEMLLKMIDLLKKKNITSKDLANYSDFGSQTTSTTENSSTGGKTGDATIGSLPKEVQSAISSMENKYGIDITDDNIRKEMQQEVNGVVPDAGKVNPTAERQINKLISDAKSKFGTKVGSLGIVSGYRSYSKQVDNFGRKAKERGVNDTQKANALPGFSQHHSGLCFDIFSTEPSWWTQNSDIKKWVSDNASKYGFVVTYSSQGPLRIAEPWHLYYIGGGSDKSKSTTPSDKKENTKKLKGSSADYIVVKNNASNDFLLVFGGTPSRSYGAKFMKKAFNDGVGNKNYIFSDWENDIDPLLNQIKNEYPTAKIIGVIGYSKGGLKAWPAISKYNFVGLIDPSIEGNYRQISDVPDSKKVIMTYIPKRGWGTTGLDYAIKKLGPNRAIPVKGEGHFTMPKHFFNNFIK